MNFGFVILHYRAYEMTVRCVSSILKMFSSDNLHIAVVDNASPNESGKRLQEHFSNESQVEVLLNHENLGFARGNNAGYDFLIQHYDLDFVIVMNNDVIIEQSDFLQKIAEKYQDTPFSVLGPDTYSTSRKVHQNPFSLSVISEEELTLKAQYYHEIMEHPGFMYLEESLRYFFINIKPVYSFVHALSNLARRILGKYSAEDEIQKKAEREHQEQLKTLWQKYREDVVLFGACYIFSRDFIRKRPYCFYPDTFMYFEEQILGYECQRDHLKVVYDPALQVLHFEDVSTRQSLKTGYQRFLFKSREMEKSCNLLLSLMRKDKEAIPPHS